MRRRGLLLLGGSAAASIGAALYLAPRPETAAAPGAGMLAFPGLAARLPQAALLEIRRHDATDVVSARALEGLHREPHVTGGDERVAVDSHDDVVRGDLQCRVQPGRSHATWVGHQTNSRVFSC
jgi:hypothetical protein